MITVPAEWVQDDLPSNYTVFESLVDDADLRIEMMSCNETALNGRNVGPSSFSMVFVAVNDPGGEPMMNSRSFYYLFEARTNNTALTEWLQGLAVKTGAGSVNHSFGPVSQPKLMESQSVLTDGGVKVYTNHGYPDDGTWSDGDKHRYFYGPDPNVDYWDDIRSYIAPSGGPGDFQAAETSEVARILDGVTTGATLFGLLQSMTRNFVPAGAGNALASDSD